MKPTAASKTIVHVRANGGMHNLLIMLCVFQKVDGLNKKHTDGGGLVIYFS